MLKQWIYMKKIDWQEMNHNENPQAVPLLEQKPEKIDWITEL